MTDEPKRLRVHLTRDQHFDLRMYCEATGHSSALTINAVLLMADCCCQHWRMDDAGRTGRVWLDGREHTRVSELAILGSRPLSDAPFDVELTPEGCQYLANLKDWLMTADEALVLDWTIRVGLPLLEAWMAYRPIKLENAWGEVTQLERE
jgi:hypothetical protein